MKTKERENMETKQRIIKFRAYEQNTKTMYSRAMVGEPSNPSVWTDSNWLECTPEVVIMQFTGLYDKNGKEIYEGDILLFDYPMGVMWNIGSWVVKTRNGSSLLYGYVYDGNVIGNIYENPGLLKEQNGYK